MRVGDVDVQAVSDGTFVARPSYFGPGVAPDAHPEFFDRAGAAWLPIGSFVLTVDDCVLLVDAGLGPRVQPMQDGMSLIGGQLLTNLRELGLAPNDVTDVVCTHLHADHVGWLFDAGADPVFAAATIWLGAADWEHFVDGGQDIVDHIRRGFQRQARRVHLIDADRPITRDVTARPASGHTPGSLCVDIASRGARLLLLGDAITGPIQLDEPSWHSFGDVHPDLAERTRERLWAELSDGATLGVGAHFPNLRPGYVTSPPARRWVVPGP